MIAMKFGLLLVILGILSQANTLPPLRDDLAALQHHSDQIQRFTDSSSLAKRQDYIARLYCDRRGNFKIVFNLYISQIVLQILEREGVLIAQSVLSDLQDFALNDPQSFMLDGTTWGAQLGNNWMTVLQWPHAAITVGIYLTVGPRFRSRRLIPVLLGILQQWFERSGYGAYAVEIPDASHAGEVGPNPKERRSITEHQTDSKLCNSPIQNWPFVFTPGKLDKLLKPLITC